MRKVAEYLSRFSDEQQKAMKAKAYETLMAEEMARASIAPSKRVPHTYQPRKTQKKIAAERRHLVIKLHNEGMNIAQIAKRLDETVAKIRLDFKKLDVKPREPTRVISPEMRKRRDRVQLMMDHGMQRKDMAFVLGITPAQVSADMEWLRHGPRKKPLDQ